MEEKNNMDVLKSIIKSNNKKLLIFVICVIISAATALGYVAFREKDNKPAETPTSYNELIGKNKEKDNEYVYVDIVDLPIPVVEQEINYVRSTYYIMYDKDSYMYVGKLSNGEVDKIQKAYAANKDNFTYTLKGYTYKVPKDVKKIIINTYNEAMKTNDVTMENYDRYFGNTYLDDVYTKYTAGAAMLEFVSIIAGITAVVFLIFWIIFIVNTNSTIKKFGKKELEDELANENTLRKDKEKMYVTEKYLIYVKNGLRVLSISDLAWIYIGDVGIGFMTAGKLCMRIHTVNKKLIKSNGVDNQKTQVFDDVLHAIFNKNPDVLIGYTYENLNKYKEMSR